eukprot:5112242-Pleurochrysis_carterae.AAC.1
MGEHKPVASARSVHISASMPRCAESRRLRQPRAATATLGFLSKEKKDVAPTRPRSSSQDSPAACPKSGGGE